MRFMLSFCFVFLYFFIFFILVINVYVHQGTTYVYDSFFRPYLAKHENDIDRNLVELRTRAGDIAVLYWQRAASYGQTRVFDILQYVAAQSTPRPRPPVFNLGYILGILLLSFPIFTYHFSLALPYAKEQNSP